jgi:hypothetical protein
MNRPKTGRFTVPASIIYPLFLYGTLAGGFGTLINMKNHGVTAISNAKVRKTLNKNHDLCIEPLRVRLRLTL